MFEAKEDIEAGEEMLLSYGHGYFKTQDRVEACNTD